MWKLADLGKAMKEWAPVKKQAPASPVPASPSPQVGLVVGKKPKMGYKMPPKAPKIPMGKAELGGPKETDWSKPDGAPVDLLNAVQRASRTKAMEDQGQKKEVAVFSEAQKRHMKDGGYPVEKSDFFPDWQPVRIGSPEPLRKNKK